MIRLPHRMCLADICNALNLKKAVEIGTHHAVFADQFMSRFRGTIELVDPWADPPETDPTFYPALGKIPRTRDEDMEIARTVMGKYGDRASFHRETSEQAAARTPDLGIDFVYIDGAHDYASVRQDLHLWYPKVAWGGIIAGHDYYDLFPDVRRAVDEFSEFSKLPIIVIEYEVHSFWMIKQ
jgi:hypothetical protein